MLDITQLKSAIRDRKSGIRKVTLLALGSRGDVQPFVALGLGLRDAGIEVTVAAAEDYRELVEAWGLRFASLVGSIREFMDRQMIYAMLDEPENPLRFIGGMMEVVRPLIKRLVRDVYDACAGVDAVVVSTLGYYAGYDVAEALDVPMVVVHLHPNVPTKAYPHVFLPALKWLPRWLESRYHLIGHTATEAAYWGFVLPPLNDARREVLGKGSLGPADIMGRIKEPIRPVLHAYSPLLTRTPADWGRDVYVTGYWFLDEPPGWQPDEGLAAFLQSGEKPVYVGFGSNLVGRDPDGVSMMIVQALEKTKQRAVILAGWGDLGNIDLPDSVYRVESVPHSWLFPHMKAIVTHCGAGTTGAALRAGVPIVPVPFFGDQLFWAARTAQLGVSTKPLPRRNLTEAGLAARIQQALDDAEMQRKSAMLGQRIQAEQGVANAIQALGWDD